MKHTILAYTTDTHMPFSTTNIQHTSNIRAAHYFHLARKINDEVTRITIDCDECSTYCQYKKHSKENTATIIYDILNHSQENFVIEIEPIS